ncbi:MAG: DegV family protein [Clostridia bacterium]|nr:DegV family protein [Clostridia bacterium]
MKVAIVTDSNSGITQKEAKQLGITVIPMPFLIDGEEFFEDINLTQEEFYQKLTQDADVSTSQPNIFMVVEKWTKLLETYDEIVHIPMSSSLSATTETAINYAKDFGGKVQVVDNKRISVTQKQSVFDAIKMASEGKSAKDIKKHLEETSSRSSIYIMVTTLKYLKKGGRVTPAAAAFGSLLKIKPVLTIQGGKLDKYCQVISLAQGKKKMLDQLANDIKTRFAKEAESGHLQISLAHTNCADKIESFKQEAEAIFKPMGIEISFVDALSLSVACHIGDGSIAITCSYKY